MLKSTTYDTSSINTPKKYKYSLTLYSTKKKNDTGNGKYKITVHSNNPSFKEVSQKYNDRQAVLNGQYSKKPTNTFRVPESTPVRHVITGKIERTNFKLILNQGTDTTTTAIIGSSYSAGKTTIMMNAIVPDFYGAKRRYDKIKEEWIPTKQKKVNINGEKIEYINMLFCDNPGLKHYEGYTDLIQCRGFDKPQQKIISDIQDIQIATKRKYRVSLYVDDILNTTHMGIVDKMFLSLRNLEISSCICVQYLYLISKKCRSNIQNIIFCKLLNAESIQNVLDVYLEPYFTSFGFPKKDHIALYMQLTDNFNFIHLHQGSNRIFLCKAIKTTF